MSSPQAAGASALLISAAKQRHIKLTPLTLRTALTSTAQRIDGVKAHEQGAGLIDINEAWESIEDGATAHSYTVKAPVDTALDQFLKPEAGFGAGIYDREGGLKTGQRKTYDVTITRTSGPKWPVEHELDLRNNDGTFRIVGDDEVDLPLNKPVTVKVAGQGRFRGRPQRHPGGGRRAHRGRRQADPRHRGRLERAGEAGLHLHRQGFGAAQQLQDATS